jgi:hypothetical protein
MLIVFSIVGKGNHSVNHIQKIKPRVEQLCREMGLQYHTEANEGRIYINLSGGPADNPPPAPGYPGYPGQSHSGGYQQHHGQQHHGGHHNQQQQQQEMQYEEEVKKALPKVLKLLKSCCIVM